MKVFILCTFYDSFARCIVLLHLRLNIFSAICFQQLKNIISFLCKFLLCRQMYLSYAFYVYS
ncbi:hypothetical protein X975_26063, partial [Stegodyphus mimosarum]